MSTFGRRVKHSRPYKLLIDTLRIAVANVEGELAALLAPMLPKADQAKKAVAMLFSAPGTVTLRGKTVRVTLEPAGTLAEYAAFDALLKQLDARKLTLPGDQSGRRLVFRIATHRDAPA